MDLPFVLDRHSPISLHVQLAGAIKEAIASHRLRPGQPLPSTRNLARTLGVSRDTVMRSYDELVSRGFLYTSKRSRTFVSPAPPGLSASTPPNSRESSLDKAVLSDFTVRLLEVQSERASAADLPDINYSATPSPFLPIKMWRKLLAEHCASEVPQQRAYVGEDFGYLPLREEISKFLNHTRGLQCDADQVVVFSNSQLPLELTARMLVNPGDLVAIETPAHSSAREIFLSHGARLVHLPIDEHGLIVENLYDIKERCKLLYVTPAHQDPTGATMSLDRRRAILEWARTNCDFVIEDGFDSDYFYKPPALPAIAGLDTEDQVVHVYSFWKVLFPLVTTACLVLPRCLIPVFSRVKASIDRNFSIIEHYALADFLGQGHLQRHVHKTRPIYQRRRQALVFALTRCFGTAVKFFGEGGGLHLTVRFDLRMTTEQILECARVSGLPMASTAGYYANDPTEGEFLISFASLADRQALPIVEAFALAVRERLAVFGTARIL